MKIAAIDSRVEAFGLTRPYTIAFRRIESVENVILRVETDSGLAGWGAASPEPRVTAETMEACRAALAPERLDWLRGRDVGDLDGLERELAGRLSATPAARAAVDMALHDLAARERGIGLVEWLGRAYETLPTSITIGIKPLAETLVEAEEYLSRGFRVLKVKIGLDLEEDLERLRRLREKVGPGVGIRADANQGYSAGDVVRFFRETASLGLEFLEQPLPADAVEAMRALPERIRERIAADESLARRRAARLRDLQRKADEMRRHRAGPAHRGDRSGGRDSSHVGVHGRESHLDRRRPPRRARVSGDALPRPRRQPRSRPRRGAGRFRARGRDDADHRQPRAGHPDARLYLTFRPGASLPF
jgi:L-alanine-DL-glutamate epimerase-like enolase superfamily enzyme